MSYTTEWMGRALTYPLTARSRAAWNGLALASAVLGREASPCFVDELIYRSGWDL